MEPEKMSFLAVNKQNGMRINFATELVLDGLVNSAVFQNGECIDISGFNSTIETKKISDNLKIELKGKGFDIR